MCIFWCALPDGYALVPEVTLLGLFLVLIIICVLKTHLDGGEEEVYANTVRND